MKSIYLFLALVAIISISSTGCKKSEKTPYYNGQNPGYKGKPGEVNKWGGVWKNFPAHPNSGGWYYEKQVVGNYDGAPRSFLVYIDSFYYIFDTMPILCIHMEDGSTAFDPFSGEKISVVNKAPEAVSIPTYFFDELKAKRKILVSIYPEMSSRNIILGYDYINW